MIQLTTLLNIYEMGNQNISSFCKLSVQLHDLPVNRSTNWYMIFTN